MEGRFFWLERWWSGIVEEEKEASRDENLGITRIEKPITSRLAEHDNLAII